MRQNRTSPKCDLDHMARLGPGIDWLGLHGLSCQRAADLFPTRAGVLSLRGATPVSFLGVHMETADVSSQLNVAIKGGIPARCRAGSILLGVNYRRNLIIDDEFRSSIRTNGVNQSVLVRPLGDDEEVDQVLARIEAGEDVDQIVAEGHSLELVAGFKRTITATQEHGESFVMPILVKKLNDAEAAAMSATENEKRSNPTPIEQAEAAANLLGRVGGDRAEAARLLSISPQTLDKRLALMNCSQKVRDALVFGKILMGHAELLAGVPKTMQDQALGHLLAMEKLMPVTEFKRVIATQAARPLATALFDKTKCMACPHNSELQSAMFSESIGAGHCTNPVCYGQLTDAVIAQQVESLKGDYPEVRIVRPGDNSTIVPIHAEGANGVGADQAQACRGCKDFGAVVSAVPGKEGQKYVDQCFNPSCNTRKVALYIKSKQEQVTPATGGSDDGKSKGKTAAPAKKSTTTSTSTAGVTAAVQEFRKKLWRRALAAELLKEPKRSIQMLIAICLTRNASNIRAEQFQAVMKKVVPGSDGRKFDFGKILPALVELDAQPQEVLSRLTVEIAGTALEGMSDEGVVQALQFYEIDLAHHFSISEEFLKLLTKSEMELMAKEVKLDKAMGEPFGKLFAKKKEDIIKDLLAVNDFNYAVVPKALRPTTK